MNNTSNYCTNYESHINSDAPPIKFAHRKPKKISKRSNLTEDTMMTPYRIVYYTILVTHSLAPVI